jgi:Putative addiction module component
MTAENLLTQALQLPLDQRANMARQLLLSLEPEPFEDDYELAWEKEIIERVKRLDEGKSETHDWREAHAGIRAKLREKKP